MSCLDFGPGISLVFSAGAAGSPLTIERALLTVKLGRPRRSAERMAILTHIFVNNLCIHENLSHLSLNADT